MTSRKGQLFVVSGPSGSGKDSIIRRVLERDDTLRLSVSCVTRPRREGEADEAKYNFISQSEFKTMLFRGEFLEHARYLGNYYGTPRRAVEAWTEQGVDVLLEIEVIGAAQVKRIMPESTAIFILPPSAQALHERLDRRGTEEPEMVRRRLRRAQREIACAHSFDYLIVNDTLSEAVEQMQRIIRCQRTRVSVNKNIIEEVLKDARSRYW